MYEYLDRDPVKGDVIECTTDLMSDFTKGKLYIMHTTPPEVGGVIDDKGNSNGFNYDAHAKVIKTKPGSKAVVGDNIISITKTDPCVQHRDLETTHTVLKLADDKLYYTNDCLSNKSNFLVLCKVEVDPLVELKAAHKAGKQIQFKLSWQTNGWSNVNNITWDYPPEQYRIKPEPQHRYVLRKGDLVKYIGPTASNPNRPSQCIIHSIDYNEDVLYYKPGHACDIKYWELIEKKFEKQDNLLDQTISFGIEHNDLVDSITTYNTTDYASTGSITSNQVTQEELDEVRKQIEELRPIQQINAEEQTMNPTTDIKIEVNGKTIDLCKHKSAACMKPKTDLESKLPFAMVVYSNTGEYISIHYNKTKKGVLKRKAKFLQKPWNLGCTVTVHQAFGEFTTSIPVVEVK